MFFCLYNRTGNRRLPLGHQALLKAALELRDVVPKSFSLSSKLYFSVSSDQCWLSVENIGLFALEFSGNCSSCMYYRGFLRYRGYLVLGSELFSELNLSGIAATDTVRARDVPVESAEQEVWNSTRAVGNLDVWRLLLTGFAPSFVWGNAKTHCTFTSLLIPERPLLLLR